MPKKGGLGKGLEAIFGEIDELDKDNRVTTISLELIERNPFQPRDTFDKKAIEELALSIKEKGVIQPIIVREKGDKYQIVAGERRYLAAKEAGLKSIPAIIKNVSDRESAEIALIENIQRKNLNPLEEAKAYKSLMENFGYTQEEVAKKVGKDRATIANSLRLLNLPDEIKEKIKKGVITAGHARAILSLKDTEKQKELAEKIVEKRLSVREVEKLTKRGENEDEFPEAALELKKVFKIVKLKKSGKRFKVELLFDSEDELINFVRKLT